MWANGKCRNDHARKCREGLLATALRTDFGVATGDSASAPASVSAALDRSFLFNSHNQNPPHTHTAPGVSQLD